MSARILCITLAFLLLGVMPQEPYWSTSVDSRTSSQWLAESAGRVYALVNGHVVAFDSRSGRRIWVSPVEAVGAPAVANGALAVPVRTGIVCIDPRSGLAAHSIITRASVTLSGSDSLIVALDELDGVLAGYDIGGISRWSRNLMRSRRDTFAGERVSILAALHGNAVAAISDSDVLIIDASNGRAVAYADGVNEVIGSDGRYLWFSIAGGGIKGLDIDTNRSVALHTNIVRDAARVENGVAVAVINGRLTKVDLRQGASIAPLHIYGRWIGGPIAGKILVERSDGVYVQGLNAGDRAVKAAVYSGDSRVVASDRDIAYVGLSDGTLLIINVESATLQGRLRTPCSFYEGFTSSGDTSIVHCDSKMGSELIGFARASTISEKKVNRRR